MPKNVPFTLFCMSKAFYCLLLAAGLLLPCAGFSTDVFGSSRNPTGLPIPESSVSAGVSFVDFRYRGPDGLLAADEDYSFSAPLAHVRLDLAAFSIYGIYGRGIGPRDNVFSELGASINSGFVVLPGTSLNLIIPLSLSTEYVLVRNQRVINNTDEFRQNNFWSEKWLTDERTVITTLAIHGGGYGQLWIFNNGLWSVQRKCQRTGTDQPAVLRPYFRSGGYFAGV